MKVGGDLNVDGNATVVGVITGSVSGNATTATTAGTVTTAAQPTITSVGTLTGLTSSGQIDCTLATTSTSTTTGAIITAGGIGVALDSFFGALIATTSDTIRIATQKTPASATATGTKGDIVHDTNYIYVCTATDTWKRTAISTW